MQTLLEDYKRKLEAMEFMIHDNINNGSIRDIERRTRLNTKASEYRSFIVDIERAIARTQSKDGKLPIPHVSKSACKHIYHHFENAGLQYLECVKCGEIK